MKRELAFGVDNFGKQKILSEKDSVAQLLINLLFMSPGQIPSMPHIGINIRQYIYGMTEDTDLIELKNQISYQCSELIPYIGIDDVSVHPLEYNGKQTLLIIIPLTVATEKQTLLIGASKNTDGRVIFKYEFEDPLT